MPIAPPAPTPLDDEDAALRLEGEIAALDTLDLSTLRTRWRQHLRTAPPPLARPLLLRLLAYRIQAKRYGELDRETARLLERIARERQRRLARGAEATKPKAVPVVPPVPNPGLGPGTVLVRVFGGKVHSVTVQAGGFDWNGASYVSLSEVARAITGTRWNGPRFFGLRGKAAPAAGEEGAP